MTGYRRLISYIYAYEGEEKGKNIGFVKLESRNGQCRLSVNVKKIYAGGNDIGVYLISSGQEIPLGNIFIRNGCGEFRTIINVENVMGTGNSLDSCIGLVIHEKGEEWRVYKTVWEDAVAQAAELELAEAAEKKPDDTLERDKRLKKQIEELNREIDEAAKVGDNITEKENAAEKNVEKENAAEGNAAEGNAAEDTAPAASGTPQNTSEPELLQQLQPSGDTPKQPSAAQAPQPFADQWVQPPAGRQSQSPIGQQSQPPAARQSQSSIAQQAQPYTDQQSQPPADRQSQPPTDQPPQSPQSSFSPFIQSTQQEEIPLGDPKVLERLDTEEEKWGPEVLWDRFRKHYPKMQAFDSPGTAEILTIRPQDIGLLPRENWGYGNNSFLLHGYYNYRYLIFARVGDEKHTRARYILGVPGHYYSNEKYMASMFGFPHFVLAKTQPAQDGRFGYWYADVRMENVE